MDTGRRYPFSACGKLPIDCSIILCTYLDAIRNKGVVESVSMCELSLYPMLDRDCVNSVKFV